MSGLPSRRPSPVRRAVRSADPRVSVIVAASLRRDRDPVARRAVFAAGRPLARRGLLARPPSWPRPSARRASSPGAFFAGAFLAGPFFAGGLLRRPPGVGRLLLAVGSSSSLVAARGRPRPPRLVRPPRPPRPLVLASRPGTSGTTPASWSRTSAVRPCSRSASPSICRSTSAPEAALPTPRRSCAQLVARSP